MKWLEECRFLSRIDVFPIENGRYGQGGHRWKIANRFTWYLVAIYLLLLKGDTPPKMKILSSFTHPQPVWVSFFCWTQRKIFWRMIGTKQLFGTIDLAEKINTMYCKSNVPKFLFVLQNIFLCVQQKKETHTGLQQLEGE